GVQEAGEKRIPSEMEQLKSVGGYNANVRLKHVPEEIKNAFENYPYIKWQFMRRRKSKRVQDIGVLKGKGKGPILLLGSGPSLDKAQPLLKNWNGAIICSGSHATTCVHAGKDPTYIMELDHRGRAAQLNSNWWRGRDTSLINQPTQAPEIARFWKWKTYYFWKMVADVALHQQIIPAAFGEWIKTYLIVFSCSVPAQMGLAYMMGYSPIILVGCDFGIDRFRAWHYEKREAWIGGHDGWWPRMWPFGKWVQQPVQSLSTEHVVRAENGVMTCAVQAYYKRSLLCGWRLDQGQVFEAVWGLNRGEPKTSILEEFVKVDMEETIESQGANLKELVLTQKEIRYRCDKYLTRQKTYAMPLGPEGTGAGVGVVLQEMNNWRKTLPMYARTLEQAGKKIDLIGLTAYYDQLERENKAEAKAKKAKEGQDG
ncbi:hypothetical protein LCGC14_1897700, partial [marine sediment metagenome]